MSSPMPAGRPLARWLLAALVLAIGLGPRIRLPGLLDRAVDLRVQDFLLVVALIYLGTRLPSLRPVWGPWVVLFVGSSSLLLVTRLLLDPTLPLLRTVAFYGRAVEMLLLAVAVAGLYRLSGARASSAALRGALVSIAANAAWVAYQYATGTQQTLIGATVADQLTAYGPRLVGEGSAFGTGFFFVFATALGVALYRSPGLSRRLSVPVVVTGVLGTYLSGSRLSLAGAVLCLVVMVLSPRGGAKPNVFAAIAAVAAGIFVVPTIPDAGRLSQAGVSASFGARTGDIWGPLLRVLGEQPLIGIGPGQLGTPDYPWTEAHNVLLRAVLDYGIIVGALFIGIFVAVLIRGYRDAADTSAPAQVNLWAGLASLFIACALIGGMVQETLIVVMSTHLIMLAVGLYAGAKLGPIADPIKPLSAVEQRIRATRQAITA